MKKNLQSILVVALALITTVSYAQDWGIDSRTRIDMSGDGDEMSTDQRVTLSSSWGGSDWGVYLSTDVNYTLNDADAAALPAISVYEVYASTNLFGFANMTAGRQALEYGAGTFVSKNEWAANRNVVEGMTFAIDNDFVGLDLGLAQRDNGDGSEMLDIMWINASKSSGDWSANLLYSDVTNMSAGASTEATAMGLDFAYSAMGGALNLDVSYNTLTMGDVEMDMMDISGTYTVNDDMSITAGRASYGENGFNDLLGLGNRGWYGTNSWMSHGNLGHLGANEENMYIGGSYSMGAFTLGATVHNVTNTEDDSYERTANEVTVGYTLSDNASVSYKMAADNNGGDEDTNYNWLTLTITP
ncbi:hypothetical protein OAR04_03960 [Flavobacteriales bacterium]|nr:hypothetical protein [Flavobacteriales bacterium]